MILHFGFAKVCECAAGAFNLNKYFRSTSTFTSKCLITPSLQQFLLVLVLLLKTRINFHFTFGKSQKLNSSKDDDIMHKGMTSHNLCVCCTQTPWVSPASYVFRRRRISSFKDKHFSATGCHQVMAVFDLHHISRNEGHLLHPNT